MSLLSLFLISWLRPCWIKILISLKKILLTLNVWTMVYVFVFNNNLIIKIAQMWCKICYYWGNKFTVSLLSYLSMRLWALLLFEGLPVFPRHLFFTSCSSQTFSVEMVGKLYTWLLASSHYWWVTVESLCGWLRAEWLSLSPPPTSKD